MKSSTKDHPMFQLQTQALRYAAPLVLDQHGWSGDVTIDPDKRFYNSAIGATGTIRHDEKGVNEARAISIADRDGKMIVTLEIGSDDSAFEQLTAEVCLTLVVHVPSVGPAPEWATTANATVAAEHVLDVGGSRGRAASAYTRTLLGIGSPSAGISCDDLAAVR